MRLFVYGASYDATGGFPWTADFLVHLGSLLVNGLTYDKYFEWLIQTSSTSPVFSAGFTNSRFWTSAIEYSDRNDPTLSRNDTAYILDTAERLAKKLSAVSYLAYDKMALGYIQNAGWQISL